MRSTEDIKRDIKKVTKCMLLTLESPECNGCENCEYDTEHNLKYLTSELNSKIAKHISIERLEQICNSEREGKLVESEHLKEIVEKTRKLNNLMLDNDYGEDLGLFRIDRDILVQEIIAECTYLALGVLSQKNQNKRSDKKNGKTTLVTY